MRIKKIALHWQVIMALLLGVLFAISAINFGWQQFTADYIEPFGIIFIKLLKMIAVPLVLFSIISGIASLGDVKKLGKMGFKTLLIYLTTTLTAILLGLLLVNVFQPGATPSEATRIEKRIEYELWLEANPAIKRVDSRRILEENAFSAEVANVRKKYNVEISDEVNDKMEKAKKAKNRGPLSPIVDIVPSNIITALADMDMLQIIFFAIIFGVVMVQMPIHQNEPISKLIESLNELFVRMVNIIINVMPLFVFALMAGTLVKSAGSDISQLKEQLIFLLNYAWVVAAALILVAFGVYPLIIHFFVKNLSYKTFLKGISKAQLTAFSTSSSVATLPVTMDCVNTNLKVPKSISSFVLPIGATVNMDGTSLYQAVAVVALAQFHLIDLAFSQQLIIVLTATLASIGAAAVPSAGLVLIIVILESVGLNPLWIAIILPIDRILDMLRTTVNVTGDAAVACVVAGLEKKNK